MIRIVNSAGKELDLNTNRELGEVLTITIEKNNPLFNDADKLLQDISYPFKAPFNENNTIFFKHARLEEIGTDAYSVPVYSQIGNVRFNAGNIVFNISPTGYECNLEINLAALSDLIKNTRITELIVNDGQIFADNDALEAHMLDTAQFPENYNWVYIPVVNDKFGDRKHSNEAGTANSMVNMFLMGGYTARNLNPGGGTFGYSWAQSPFYKVKYLLKLIADFFDFKLEGAILTDPAFEQLCIYTRRSDSYLTRNHSPAYFPNMTIGEVLKQLRERKHLSIDFDLARKVLTVESFNSIYTSKKATDLTEYISLNIEQQAPTEKGYTVSLMPDDQDDGFNETTADYLIRKPLSKITIGEGLTEIKLACTTTNAVDYARPDLGIFISNRFPLVSQATFNTHEFTRGIPHGNKDDPNDKNVDYARGIGFADVNDPTTLNNWPLRLIRYEGWTEIFDGSFSPNGYNDELDATDIQFYRFLNDSKRLIITVYIPANILAGMRTTDKYTYKTAGGNYVYLIIEKFVYDIGLDSDRVPVKIYARILTIKSSTKFSISTAINPLEVGDIEKPKSYMLIKAYFNPEIHGVTQVTVEPRFTASPPQYAWSGGIITIPATSKGTGGRAIVSGLNISSLPIGDYSPIEIRIKEGKPKYLQFSSYTWNFVDHGDYSSVIFDPNSEVKFYGAFYIIHY
jgi:hypothetical protein